MQIERIDDPNDARLSDYRDLTDRQMRHLRERATDSDPGFFIAEGPLLLAALADRSWSVRSALIASHRVESLRAVLDRLSGPIYVAPRPLLDAVSGFPVHRGVLAAGIRPRALDWREIVPSSRRLLLAEAVNDLENVGSLFRNASAFGVDGVILSPGCADPLYRRCLRVSMGHALRVPFAVADDWPAPIDGLVNDGWDVLAMTPSGDVDLRTLPPSDRAAVLVGAEGLGLTLAAQKLASRRVRIAMSSEVDSVNVAVAAALAFQHLN